MLVFACADNFKPENFINMAAVLFMWITMPAYGAASYVPAIVLGKCNNQTRILPEWVLLCPHHTCIYNKLLPL